MSDDVRRFDPKMEACGSQAFVEMELHPTGSFVSIVDYDRLRAEVKRLKEDVRFWNETAIEYKRQLFETIRRGPESAGLHIITDEQIDKAWELTECQLEYASGAGHFAERIGIVECPECHGSGLVWPGMCLPQIECHRCQGRRWIREERGDE
jgi:hypothetical protein